MLLYSSCCLIESESLGITIYIFRKEKERVHNWLSNVINDFIYFDYKHLKVSLMMMMKKMNCFCGMVDRRKAFSLISTWGHCQRSSPSQISDTPWVGFESAQKLSSGFIEWSCALVITTTPRRHNVWYIPYI